MSEALYRAFRMLASGHVDPARPLSGGRQHCCEHMTAAVTHVCAQHADPFECPDCLILYDHVYDEYGVIVHDGGPSSVLIRFCPWCGAGLPDSKRDSWFDALAQLGVDDTRSDDIPEPFRSDAWWQARATQKRA